MILLQVYRGGWSPGGGSSGASLLHCWWHGCAWEDRWWLADNQTVGQLDSRQPPSPLTTKNHLEALQFPVGILCPDHDGPVYLRLCSFWVPKHRSRRASQTSGRFFSRTKKRSSRLQAWWRWSQPWDLDPWWKMSDRRLVHQGWYVMFCCNERVLKKTRFPHLLLFFRTVLPSKKCEAILRCSFWQLMVKALCFF